jgi:CO/xanthine dehydrogenase Mo-binding subunit
MGIRLVDNPYEYGPFGAKGAGELPFIGAAPAFTSAVQNALGIPVTRLPVTPEYILEIAESEN